MFESGWVKRALRGGAPAHLYTLATVALLAAGTWFRSRRYFVDPVGLTVDEGSWGHRLLSHPVTEMQFRPIGYMALTKLFVAVYSNEATLRILSYLAALASLGMAYDLGRRLFRSRIARLSCLALVAFHPLLIDMAREFKPYSLEFTVHLGLIWLFYRWRAQRKDAWLYALLVFAALSFLLAYNVVLALPSLFLVLGVIFLGERSYRKLLLTVLAAVLALAVIGAVYFFIIRLMGPADDGKSFWGQKYHVFYLSDDAAHPWLGQARWTLGKYLELATFPNVQRGSWVFPASVSPEDAQVFVKADWYLWLSLHLIGLVVLLLPRRRVMLCLLFGPLLVTMAFNARGVWPFGVFRANTFLLAYYLLIPLVGLDALITRRGVFGIAMGTLGCLAILGTNLSIGFDAHERKQFFTAHSELRTVLRRLVSLRDGLPEADRARKLHVFLDAYSCPPTKFSLEFSDATRAEFGDSLQEKFNFTCLGRRSALSNALRRSRGEAFFVVVADDRSKHSIRAEVSRLAEVLDAEDIRGTEGLYLARAH